MGQTLLQNTLALIVTLGLLVTIHEFGHFWVARRCGVKVLRFSVGFGRPILKWLDRHGTEYVVAALPLGGYVKMLDEREAPVAPELLDQAFNRKPVAQRIAIASAGPLANFLFALMAYWIMFVAGVQVVVPKIGGLSVGALLRRRAFRWVTLLSMWMAVWYMAGTMLILGWLIALVIPVSWHFKCSAKPRWVRLNPCVCPLQPGCRVKNTLTP